MGFQTGIKLNNGSAHNGQFISVEKGTVTGFPVIVEITSKDGASLKLNGVMH